MGSFRSAALKLPLQQIVHQDHRRFDICKKIADPFADKFRRHEIIGLGHRLQDREVEYFVEDEDGPVERLQRIVDIGLFLIVVVLLLGRHARVGGRAAWIAGSWAGGRRRQYRPSGIAGARKRVRLGQQGAHVIQAVARRGAAAKAQQ